MPLSKKRQAEYMKAYRAKKGAVIPKILSTTTYDDHIEVIEEWRTNEQVCVIPSVIPKQAWEITNWASVDMSMNPQLKAPIPNCPDGRYRAR